MVLRLFVQPSEGLHWIVPKRSEPLPANATLQSSVAASTILAAGYASYARAFGQRVGSARGLSAPGLFIRASARTGVWCALVGGATNWYYHYALTKPVVAYSGIEPSPFKLWDRTEKYTADDGFLAGAGLGLVSALFLRRVPISWWSRFVGMANIGGFTGMAASNAWFQYAGERQKAVASLKEWRYRRNLEFHWIYWNKVFMTKLSTVAQGYIVLNGIFHANLLPEEVLKSPEKYGLSGFLPAENTKEEGEDTPDEPSYLGFYQKAYDHAENLKQIDVEGTKSQLRDMEQERLSLQTEAEYALTQLSRKQYEYCHAENMDDDERQRRMREIQLMEVTFNRLRLSADVIDRKIVLWYKALQQKAAWESTDLRASWTPTVTRCREPDKHDPALTLEEMTKMRDSFIRDIADFESIISSSGASEEQRRNSKKDLDDARILLQAADRLTYELEKMGGKADGGAKKIDTKETPDDKLEPEKS